MKRMKIVLVSVLAVLTIIFLTACANNSETIQDGSEIILNNFQIHDAKTLISMPPERNIRAASSKNILYKIDNKGDLKIVKCEDNNGNIISAPAPRTIISINENWIIMCYDAYKDGNFLINKVSGSVYKLPFAPETLRANSGFGGETRESVFVDKNNNIYFLAGGRVQKIFVDSSGQVSITAITPDIYHINSVNEFSVDIDGNVIFSYEVDFVESIKIRNTSGSLLAIPKNQGSIDYCFAGYDGSIYLDGKKYTVVNNSFNSSTYGLQPNDFSSRLGNRGAGSQGLRWLYLEDSIWVTDRSAKYIGELYNTNSSITPNIYAIGVANNEIVKNVYHNKKEIYFTTADGRILKFDPKTHTTSEIYNSNSRYDFYKFCVTDNGVIQFSAIDLTNSHKVLAEWLNGSLQILSDNLTEDVSILQRIK